MIRFPAMLAGMSRRLVAFAGVLVGFVRGGLSLVNILASTFFGGISGSAVADTASIGSVLIPEMERKGVTLSLRRDIEKKLTKEEDEILHSAIQRNFSEVK